MTINYVEPLTRAWNRMTRILFSPFDFVKWLVLGFSAWLAGLASGGGGGQGWSGVNDNDIPGHREVMRDLGEAMDRLFENVILVPLILLAVLLLVAIVLALLWLSSRAKFIFLDNVVHDRAAIVEPWKRFVRLGNSLFMWRVGFVLVSICIVVVFIALMVGPALGFAWHDGLHGLSLASAILGGLLLFIFAVGATYVALFLESFIIPIMYKYDLKATAAWRSFLPWLSKKGVYFLLYGLFVLALWILFAIVFSVACLMTCCILLLPYVGTVLLLPVIVTYRLLSVEFLAQFDSGFDLFVPLEPSPEETATP